MSGRVYLVGAGPGDPGLLTRRGERCLAAADIVVHDRLVGPRLLDLVRPGAEVIALGRSHDDRDRPSQEAIEALLVERARAGKTVVRLKNGDPFLLGRGAEEAEALRRAEVPFEVVPGVSSAFAVPAHAGIPLTHRDHASLVTIATGHQARVGDETVPPALPWDALARQGGTLVFLMGMRQMAAIMAALIAHGLAADTPAAAIQSGTTRTQATVVATAGTLAAPVHAAGAAPCASRGRPRTTAPRGWWRRSRARTCAAVASSSRAPRARAPSSRRRSARAAPGWTRWSLIAPCRRPGRTWPGSRRRSRQGRSTRSPSRAAPRSGASSSCSAGGRRRTCSPTAAPRSPASVR